MCGRYSLIENPRKLSFLFLNQKCHHVFLQNIFHTRLGHAPGRALGSKECTKDCKQTNEEVGG